MNGRLIEDRPAPRIGVRGLGVGMGPAATPQLSEVLGCRGRRPALDRLDALVWALTELAPGRVSAGALMLMTAPSRWAPLRQGIGGGW
jgi:hypothetical protein